MSREQQKTTVRYATHANAALKPDYRGTAVPKIQPRPAVVPKKKPRKEQVSVYKTAFTMLIIASMLVLMVSRYAMISANNIEIQKLKNSIAENKDIASHLEIDLSSSTDMAYLQAAAQDQLGMGYPKEEQVVRIELNDTNTSEVIKTNVKSNWFDKLLDKFNTIEGRILN